MYNHCRTLGIGGALHNRYIYVRFEVLTAVKMTFWDVTPFGLIGRSSALKMETVCFSETLASTYESIWHHNPEEHHQVYSGV
jgi:hypothetical protein